MAGQEETEKKENALVRYLRDTRAELRRVRWPSRSEAWSLTKIVLAVTLGMAIFLGALDLFFGWVLGGIIDQNLLYIALAGVVVITIAVSAVLIGRGEEA